MVFLRNLVSTLNVGGKGQIFYGNKISKNNHNVGVSCNIQTIGYHNEPCVAIMLSSSFLHSFAK